MDATILEKKIKKVMKNNYSAILGERDVQMEMEKSE